MKRYRQSLDELLAALAAIETSWRDDHSDAVIELIEGIPEKPTYTQRDIGEILDRDFDAGLTAIRLVLELSKDELGIALKAELGDGGTGVTRFRNDRSAFIQALESLGTTAALQGLVGTPVTWRHILRERLKSGRGSAIKGQARGRSLEDFAERIVKTVFQDVGYDARCRFVGATGTSTEKTDFAIPSKTDARILIEVKAYGATGSKQTDILGDIGRIVEQKRHDTHLLLVTDGVTWKARVNDLRSLVDMQNRGLIARIYTQSMGDELNKDLLQLRKDHSL